MKRIITYLCDGCDKAINGTAIGIQYSEAGSLVKKVTREQFDDMGDLCCSYPCAGVWLARKVEGDITLSWQMAEMFDGGIYPW